MVQLICSGNYSLIETNNNVKILTLDTTTYAWIHTATYGEILVYSHNPHHTDNILAKAKYRLYSVKNEARLTDEIHLELYVGNNIWQGYLLPTGLPNDIKTRSRIIPTSERITFAAI